MRAAAALVLFTALMASAWSQPPQPVPAAPSPQPPPTPAQPTPLPTPATAEPTAPSPEPGAPLPDQGIAPQAFATDPAGPAADAASSTAASGSSAPFTTLAQGGADAPTPPAGGDWEWLRAAAADTVVCPFRGRIDYRPGRIECGLIQVPENREVAGSRTIELHFVRLLAKGEDHEGNPVETRADPVVYLTGGPGVGADYYVGRLKDHRILEQRDVYILEQRGIGSSSPFCAFFDTRNRAAQVRDTFAGQQQLMIEQARACFQGARAQGVDLRGYNTFENARDVRALRQALGLDRWNVWGISYGSVLAQAVAKVDPDGIQAMVIDGIVPLDIADLMRIGRWYRRDLDQLFAACAQQPDCADAYPDQARRYLAAIESTLAQPFALEVDPDERYPDGKAYVFADVVAGLPFQLLYEQSQHAALPAIIEGLIDAVERRDETLFKAIAVADMGAPGGSTYGAGMSAAIRCQDGYVDRFAAVAAQEHAENPALAAAFGTPELAAGMVAACAAAGLPGRDVAAYAPLQTALPVLVVNGAWDPVTPTPLAQYVMPGLANGQLVEFPHAGHGPTRSVECAGALLNAYFDDPAAPVNMDCVNDGEQAAVFVAPYFATSVVAKAAILGAGDRKRLIPHAAWGGISALLVLIGLLVLSGGWLARRLDRRPRAPGSVARTMTGLAALAGVGHAAGLGAAAAVSGKITPALLLFGFVPWAVAFAWLGPIAGLLGVVALLLAFGGAGLGRAGRIGCALVALAAISLSVFGWYWDLWPL
jgi:pimeloyl-ACP methyl ester carboxylesterase